MSSELNSVQESIKLALDAADAATDVTSEYSQVKREHKKLEQKVSQIHRYTTMTFVTAIGDINEFIDEINSTRSSLGEAVSDLEGVEVAI